MLSGQGNAGELTVKNNNMSNQQKSNFVRAAHFAFVLHDYNVKVPETSYSYTFYGGNVVRVLIYYFLLPLILTFHQWPLAFLIFSLPLQNSRAVLPTKKCLLCCLSLALDLSPFFSLIRWPADYFLFFSVFLLLYFPNLWT